MRSILLVGGIGAGKTTFRRRLQGLPIEYVKTQAIEIFVSVTGTPGEYLEAGRCKHALMLTSYDVDVVVLVQSVTSDEVRFLPGFTTTFSREMPGVVTHTGVAIEAQAHGAVDHLARAGAHRVVAVDPMTSKGLKCAQEVLCRTSS